MTGVSIGTGIIAFFVPVMLGPTVFTAFSPPILSPLTTEVVASPEVLAVSITEMSSPLSTMSSSSSPVVSSKLSPTPTSTAYIISTPKPTLRPSPQASIIVSPLPKASLKPSPQVSISPTPKPSVTPKAAPTGAQLDEWFTKYANEQSINRDLLRKIAICESNLNSNAKNGDYGGMYQFSTKTWTTTRGQMNKDSNPTLRFDAEAAIHTAAFRIATLGDRAWPNCR